MDTAQRLLVSGASLPSDVAFGIVDAVFARAEKYGHHQEGYLLRQAICLCAFVDDPARGIEKMRESVAKARLAPHDLREIISALGESRSDAATGLLIELVSQTKPFADVDENWFKAIAKLDTSEARDLLLSFVEPDNDRSLNFSGWRRDDVVASGISELAVREPAVAERLRKLCELELPEPKRQLLSKVLSWMGLGTLESNLLLIDDSRPYRVPQGTWEQIEEAFVQRRASDDIPNAYTQEARTSNELRRRLFAMAINDNRRRKAAFSILGQIEEWRLRYGRPAGEPRHPDFPSGYQWPPNEPENGGASTGSSFIPSATAQQRRNKNDV